MSERYEKLFSLQENLYAEGSPVVVSAGNLLKDTQTGKLLAQLKFKSLSPKTIKAARIVLSALDTLGKPLDSETEKEYLDLFVGQDEEFGQKTAIPLANGSTRGYTVRVKQVIFADNSTWDGTDAAWVPLPAAESLLQKLGDEELIKQFQLKFGGKCEVFPREHKDLWLCACGAWNREPKCRGCGKEKAALLSLELPALTAEKDARLAKEQADREAKEAAEKEAKEKSAKKTKKILSFSIPAAVVLLAALLLVTKVLIPNSNYSKAKALLDAGQYEEAITAFEALNGYKDSSEQIKAAEASWLEEKNAAAYAKAEELLASDLSAAIVAFESLGEYRDSADRAKLARAEKTAQEQAAAYAEAEALLNTGDFGRAYQAFQKLGGYQDSTEQAEAILQAHPALAFLGAKKGDEIVFGAYEQDNDRTNGKEPIEWTVLSTRDDKILVISKYALDNMPYNESNDDVTWESCTLRKWLNGAFLDSAFSGEEKASILSTAVSAAKNPLASTKPGKDTQDKLFLLSREDLDSYFKPESTAGCKPTAFAKSKSVFTENGKCKWWLRVPGYEQDYAAYVFPSGGWWYKGCFVADEDVAVRPAMWIDLRA